MGEIEAYFEQFRGDEPERGEYVRFELGAGYVSMMPAPGGSVYLGNQIFVDRDVLQKAFDEYNARQATHEDYIAVCREKGRHEWYKLHGGFQCRQCGLQIPVHEPFNQATMVLVIARQAELDAELRRT